MRFFPWLALAVLTPSVSVAQMTTTNAITTILHADGEYRQAVSSVFYVNIADCAASDSVLVAVAVSSTLKTTLGSAPQIWMARSMADSYSLAGGSPRSSASRRRAKACSCAAS